jgi:hypothetical protein
MLTHRSPTTVLAAMGERDHTPDGASPTPRTRPEPEHTSRPRRTLIPLLTVALAASFSVANVGSASAHDDQSGSRARFAPIAGNLHGRSAADLAAEAIAPLYTAPAAETPFGGGDPCPRAGNHGRVLVLAIPTSCTIERGDDVIALPGASCSDVEPAPFFAIGETAQRQCAEAATNDFLVSTLISVDGGPQVEVIDARFAATTDQQHITVVPDNLFGATPGPGTFVASAYVPVLRHLPEGSHTIDITSLTSDGRQTSSYTINVVDDSA